MRRLLPTLAAGTAAFIVLVLPARGQTLRVVPNDAWCDEAGDHGRNATVCEVRETTLSPREVVAVAAVNGGIKVEAGSGDRITLRARVVTNARTEGAARDLLRRVEVETNGTIRARAPRPERNTGTSVAFELTVPRRSNLDLESVNGGIKVAGVTGRIALETVNGGLDLESVGGDVRGETTNGGVDVTVAGRSWEGDGLDVRALNGGVRLRVPEAYSADLDASTQNGRVRLGFAVPVEGEVGRRVQAKLGSGGAPLRLTTMNGGVTIERR